MSNASAPTAANDPEAYVRTTRVPSGAPAHNEISDFLIDEADMLDQQRFAAWGELLAKDLRYTAPMRITRTGPNREQTIIRSVMHFDDDHTSIMGRLGRLAGKSAWAEDPPSRTRRFVTNFRVWETSVDGEYEALTNLLLSRSRYEQSELMVFSCERRDLLRRVDRGFQIARREILVDQSVLGMPNFAVFL